MIIADTLIKRQSPTVPLRYRFVASKGQSIGLLGGSFDPSHAGHLHITREAMKRFGLTQVWWLVSPGNPLKTQVPAPVYERVRQAQELARHPRIIVTDIESVLHSPFTADTLEYLRKNYPGVRFVWLMGADNLVQFHRWHDWQWIIETFPIGIIVRSAGRIPARFSRAARIYRRYRLNAHESQLLSHVSAPSWCFVNAPMVSDSSSAIRASRITSS